MISYLNHLTHSLSLKSKIFFAIFSIGILSLILGIGASLYLKDNLHKTELNKSIERLTSSLKEKIAKKEDVGITNVVGFSANESLIKEV